MARLSRSSPGAQLLPGISLAQPTPVAIAGQRQWREGPIFPRFVHARGVEFHSHQSTASILPLPRLHHSSCEQRTERQTHGSARRRAVLEGGLAATGEKQGGDDHATRDRKSVV